MEAKRIKSETTLTEEDAETSAAGTPDVETMVIRGAETIRYVLKNAGSAKLTRVKGARNEIQYLINVAEIAAESGSVFPDPAEEKLNRARLRGMKRIVELRKAAEPVLETGQVCDFLGLSRETIRKKVDCRKLLALPKGADRVFPILQFRDGAIVPGFSEALEALDTGSPFTALSFFLSKSPDFAGKSAIELLHAGKTEPVLTQARTFLKHGG